MEIEIARSDSIRQVVAVVIGVTLLVDARAFAQNPSPSPGTPIEATTERFIATGSNIPTAEEVGPNPVDTYRPSDLEELGIRNATDLMTQLPQELGASVNQNIANSRVGGR